MSSTPSLAGKVALVTGASKGIGASTARLLVALGANVVINYNSDGVAADKLVSELGVEKAYAVKADVGNMSEIQALVNATIAKFGKIDILILNAATMPIGDIEATTETDFDNVYNLNVKGPFFLVQGVVPYMAPGSTIIFVSTSLAHDSNVRGNCVLYCSSKGAIEQMTRVLSKDLLRKKGITVNCIAPGPTGTELFFQGKSEQMLKNIAALSPTGRIGQPEEIASVIAFLSSEGASWISGQVLRVNGGTA